MLFISVMEFFWCPCRSPTQGKYPACLTLVPALSHSEERRPQCDGLFVQLTSKVIRNCGLPSVVTNASCGDRGRLGQDCPADATCPSREGAVSYIKLSLEDSAAPSAGTWYPLNTMCSSAH